MFGFLIGTACLVGLFKVMRHGHHHHHGRFGGPFGRRGFRGHGRQGRFGWFGKRGMYRLFETLDTTPGQEKVIMGAISDLRDFAKGIRGDIRGTASDVADAFRSDSLDEDAFSALFDGHLSRIDSLRAEFAKTVAKIHEALAPEQRDRLADFLESRARWASVAM